MSYPVSVCGIIHRNVSLFKHSIKKKRNKNVKVTGGDRFFSFVQQFSTLPSGGRGGPRKEENKGLNEAFKQ